MKSAIFTLIDLALAAAVISSALVLSFHQGITLEDRFIAFYCIEPSAI
ncbi:MAG: hypothetical protein ACR2RE_23110 [Geminicoccaceae bacterium]